MSLRTRRGFITRPLRRLARRGAREWTDMAARPERPDVTPLADSLHGHSFALPGAGAAAALRGPAAAVQRRLPGGREHPGLAGARPRRATTRRRGGSWSPTIRCRPSTGGSATTRARASATAPSSTARSRSTRSSGSSATWRSSAAGDSIRRRRRSGKRVLVIGAGPSGLSAAYHLARRGHEVEIRDAGDQPGGMMRYGIPAYRLPRDVLEARDRADRRARRADHPAATGWTTWTRSGARAASTRCSSRSARICPSGWTSRPATRARSWTRCRSCAASPRASGRRSGGGSPCTAAATRRWTPPGSPAAWAPRRR